MARNNGPEIITLDSDSDDDIQIQDVVVRHPPPSLPLSFHGPQHGYVPPPPHHHIFAPPELPDFRVPPPPLPIHPTAPWHISEAPMQHHLPPIVAPPAVNQTIAIPVPVSSSMVRTFPKKKKRHMHRPHHLQEPYRPPELAKRNHPYHPPRLIRKKKRPRKIFHPYQSRPDLPRRAQKDADGKDTLQCMIYPSNAGKTLVKFVPTGVFPPFQNDTEASTAPEAPDRTQKIGEVDRIKPHANDEANHPPADDEAPGPSTFRSPQPNNQISMPKNKKTSSKRLDPRKLKAIEKSNGNVTATESQSSPVENEDVKGSIPTESPAVVPDEPDPNASLKFRLRSRTPKASSSPRKPPAPRSPRTPSKALTKTTPRRKAQKADDEVVKEPPPKKPQKTASLKASPVEQDIKQIEEPTFPISLGIKENPPAPKRPRKKPTGPPTMVVINPVPLPVENEPSKAIKESQTSSLKDVINKVKHRRTTELDQIIEAPITMVSIPIVQTAETNGVSPTIPVSSEKVERNISTFMEQPPHPDWTIVKTELAPEMQFSSPPPPEPVEPPFVIMPVKEEVSEFTFPTEPEPPREYPIPPPEPAPKERRAKRGRGGNTRRAKAPAKSPNSAPLRRSRRGKPLEDESEANEAPEIPVEQASEMPSATSVQSSDDANFKSHRVDPVIPTIPNNASKEANISENSEVLQELRTKQEQPVDLATKQDVASDICDSSTTHSDSVILSNTTGLESTNSVSKAESSSKNTTTNEKTTQVIANTVVNSLAAQVTVAEICVVSVEATIKICSVKKAKDIPSTEEKTTDEINDVAAHPIKTQKSSELFMTDIQSTIIQPSTSAVSQIIELSTVDAIPVAVQHDIQDAVLPQKASGPKIQNYDAQPLTHEINESVPIAVVPSPHLEVNKENKSDHLEEGECSRTPSPDPSPPQPLPVITNAPVNDCIVLDSDSDDDIMVII